MLRKLKMFSMTALIAVMTMMTAKAEITQDYSNNNNIQYDNSSSYGQIQIDRYLDVEVWTNHPDNEFYEGDNIVLNFRANRDAFVAIYTVDTKGRVNLLFPSSPNDNNFIQGGETYRLPDQSDDFDFVVSGPEGVEHIQIIASKERFPIPDWYPTSGIIDDSQDTFEFMDYLNSRYFVRYDGQRFAFDRASVYINEWEDDYYRPVYYPSYPSWTVAGNVYIDYPYGASVYINGVFWGIAPLYIPRIYVGWHTVTIYDHFGHCWENDVHITRYNTLVLNRTIIHTSANVRSKYKEVRTVGYRDPVKNGYPKYKETRSVNTNKVGVKQTATTVTTKKKYVRGSAEVVKTSRGYETTGGSKEREVRTTARDKYAPTYERKSDKSGGGYSNEYRKSNSDSKPSTGTYRKSSGKSPQTSKPTYKKSESSSSKKSSSSRKAVSSKKSSRNDDSDRGSKKVEKKSSDSGKKESKSSSSQKSSSDKKSSDKGGKKKGR